MEAQGIRRPRASHSDRGSQYEAISFGKRLQGAGVVPSMGRTGTALDNAMAGSMSAIFEHLEGSYNRCRLHSALSYRSPADYEEATMEGVAVA
jgi:putative transposase